jgi:hypothetical protein
MKYQVHLDTSETNVIQKGGSGRIVEKSGNPFLASIFLGVIHRNVNTVELKSVEIPIGFYNIRSPYNTFTINGTTYTVSPGNYTLTRLVLTLSDTAGYIFALAGSRITLNDYGQLYSMTSPFTFTNMGAAGGSGPVSITYGASTPGLATSSVLVLSAGIQYWTVPQTKTYTFTLTGASSFHTTSLNAVKVGYGMVMTASRRLVAGQRIAILVGQQGIGNADGAGGTFIALVPGVGQLTDAIPLFVAGGAGGPGGESTAGSNATINATITTKGRDGGPGIFPAFARGLGGIGPDGGNVPSTKGFSFGDAGAGFIGNGAWSTTGGDVNNVPLSFINGGRGGTNNGRGGFGGGAGFGAYSLRSGGGGGGYGGGGAGGSSANGAGGGGGGSYDITGTYSGTATNVGPGYVTISFSP